MPYVKYQDEWYEVAADQSPPTQEELEALPHALRARVSSLVRTKTGELVLGHVFDEPIDGCPIHVVE
jgi:hypothetical protein